MDQTGCSDSGSVICSEFSSTPNTSVCSTPQASPTRKRRVVPTPVGPTKSKGKDLSLLMASQPGLKALPKDSLYFREMARSKTTARKKTGGPGKTPLKQLATKSLTKKLTPGQVQEEHS